MNTYELPEPDIKKLAGEKFLTGKHIIALQKRANFLGEDMEIVDGTAFVNGKMHSCRQRTIEALQDAFFKQFGSWDSCHYFENDREAHKAFPRLFLDPDGHMENWKIVTPLG